MASLPRRSKKQYARASAEVAINSTFNDGFCVLDSNDGYGNESTTVCSQGPTSWPLDGFTGMQKIPSY
ncbi:hypothetical protein BFJ67_g17731 [Fusarium oxysporum f. sp. cepae]|nr:hypothetical protein BFJ67_g17731 [Fusarium oxysporum f. sp. cepae]